MEVIAYYLPQFHPITENDEWWGEGFTEWTNVGKAKSLFKGHYQPKVPKDLGYYDLRIPEVREKQVKLAKEAGVTAFCYWHYWFGKGKQLMEMPLKEVVSSGQPDFPFCLGWANESWYAKVWSTGSKMKDKLLIEQQYPGIEDIELHFYTMLDTFRDRRYLRIDNKPVFVVYKPANLPDPDLFIRTWNKLAVLNNLSDGFYFIAHTVNAQEIDKLLKMGFDAVNVVRIMEHRFDAKVRNQIPFSMFRFFILKKPMRMSYSFISNYFVRTEEERENVFPTLIPNWDHTPRSGQRGLIFQNSTPALFAQHVLKALSIVKKKPKNRQVLFLKSWNEWGEGNYMEPDLRYGKGYIEEMGKAVQSVQNSDRI